MQPLWLQEQFLGWYSVDACMSNNIKQWYTNTSYDFWHQDQIQALGLYTCNQYIKKKRYQQCDTKPKIPYQQWNYTEWLIYTHLRLIKWKSQDLNSIHLFICENWDATEFLFDQFWSAKIKFYWNSFQLF